MQRFFHTNKRDVLSFPYSCSKKKTLESKYIDYVTDFSGCESMGQRSDSKVRSYALRGCLTSKSVFLITYNLWLTSKIKKIYFFFTYAFFTYACSWLQAPLYKLIHSQRKSSLRIANLWISSHSLSAFISLAQVQNFHARYHYHHLFTAKKLTRVFNQSIMWISII